MGEKIGEPVKTVVEAIFNSKSHPEQGFRAALGLFRLARVLGDDRLLNACKKAISLGSPTYKSVKSILETGQDKCLSVTTEEQKLPVHENIRGAAYYQNSEESQNASTTNH